MFDDMMSDDEILEIDKRSDTQLSILIDFLKMKFILRDMRERLIKVEEYSNEKYSKYIQNLEGEIRTLKDELLHKEQWINERIMALEHQVSLLMKDYKV